MNLEDFPVHLFLIAWTIASFLYRFLLDFLFAYSRKSNLLSLLLFIPFFRSYLIPSLQNEYLRLFLIQESFHIFIYSRFYLSHSLILI